MNRTQKIVGFNLIVVSIALTLSFLSTGIMYFVFNLPLRGAMGGFGFFGILGLLGLSPFIYKNEKSKVSFDERDILIQRNALLGAYSIFWVLLVLSAMIPFFITGAKGTISVIYLPLLVLGGMTMVTLVQSIVTLVLYGRGEKS